MKLFANLFKPRQLPGWWSRFTETYPVVSNVMAVTGLAYIFYSLSPMYSSPKETEYGLMIETFKATIRSEVLVEKAISLRSAYHQWIPEDVRKWAFNLYGYPTLYLVVPFLLLLEFLFPCKVSQPLIGKAFLQDAIWFAASVPTKILILGGFSQFLHSFYNDYLSFLTVDSLTAWPAYLQIITALLLVELLNWLTHFIRHKIRVLWLFHAVHHSQKEMNVFTDDRGHVIDRIVSPLLMFIPFYILKVPDLYAVAVMGLFISVQSRFVHANVKINLGWLGFLITSPQFHRVHHSAEPEHQDKNYGGVISVFDYLFGTAYPSRYVYPETGIADSRFPNEDKVRVRRLPKNWILQTVYPFVSLFKSPQASPGDENGLIRDKMNNSRQSSEL